MGLGFSGGGGGGARLTAAVLADGAEYGGGAAGPVGGGGGAFFVKVEAVRVAEETEELAEEVVFTRPTVAPGRVAIILAKKSKDECSIQQHRPSEAYR